MTSAVFADTGPLYAAVDPDDAYHARAQRELKRPARNHQDVIIAYPTLLEAYTLVLNCLGRRSAANWLGNIRAGAALPPAAPERGLETKTYPETLRSTGT